MKVVALAGATLLSGCFTANGDLTSQSSEIRVLLDELGTLSEPLGTGTGLMLANSDSTPVRLSVSNGVYLLEQNKPDPEDGIFIAFTQHSDATYVMAIFSPEDGDDPEVGFAIGRVLEPARILVHLPDCGDMPEEMRTRLGLTGEGFALLGCQLSRPEQISAMADWVLETVDFTHGETDGAKMFEFVLE